MIELVRIMDLRVGDVVLSNDATSSPLGSPRGTVVRVNRNGVVVQWPSGSSVESNYPRGYVAGPPRPAIIRREVDG